MRIRYRYTVSDNNNRGSFGSLTTMEITMEYDYIQLDYGYNVKYKNGTLYLTDRRWKYMFDASTLKLGDLKYALKHYNIDSLPYLAKFRRHSDTNLWELYATK